MSVVHSHHEFLTDHVEQLLFLANLVLVSIVCTYKHQHQSLLFHSLIVDYFVFGALENKVAAADLKVHHVVVGKQVIEEQLGESVLGAHDSTLDFHKAAHNVV